MVTLPGRRASIQPLVTMATDSSLLCHVSDAVSTSRPSAVSGQSWIPDPTVTSSPPFSTSSAGAGVGAGVGSAAVAAAGTAASPRPAAVFIALSAVCISWAWLCTPGLSGVSGLQAVSRAAAAAPAMSRVKKRWNPVLSFMGTSLCKFVLLVFGVHSINRALFCRSSRPLGRVSNKFSALEASRAQSGPLPAARPLGIFSSGSLRLAAL